jgi:hypothetical protein
LTRLLRRQQGLHPSFRAKPRDADAARRQHRLLLLLLLH